MSHQLFFLMAVSFCVLITACKKQTPSQDTNTVLISELSEIKTQHYEHHHEHKAPHGGMLVELGREFAHIELVFNSSAGKLTAYILDGEAEYPIRLPNRTIDILIEKKKYVMVAVDNPLTGEKIGDSSEFSVLSPMLKSQTSFYGEFPSLSVKGASFKNITFKISQDHGGVH